MWHSQCRFWLKSCPQQGLRKQTEYRRKPGPHLLCRSSSRAGDKPPCAEWQRLGEVTQSHSRAEPGSHRCPQVSPRPWAAVGPWLMAQPSGAPFHISPPADCTEPCLHIAWDLAGAGSSLALPTSKTGRQVGRIRRPLEFQQIHPRPIMSWDGAKDAEWLRDQGQLIGKPQARRKTGLSPWT